MKNGDKVHYVPFDGCTNEECRNGMIKRTFTGMDDYYYVAYGCQDPADINKHKGELTLISKLKEDWVEQNFPEDTTEEEEEW